jgi:hypothetical protein
MARHLDLLLRLEIHAKIVTKTTMRESGWLGREMEGKARTVFEQRRRHRRPCKPRVTGGGDGVRAALWARTFGSWQPTTAGGGGGGTRYGLYEQRC